MSCLDVFKNELHAYSDIFFICLLIAAGAGLHDLMSFWTGWEVLPQRVQELWIKLDDTREATSLVESSPFLLFSHCMSTTPLLRVI